MTAERFTARAHTHHRVVYLHADDLVAAVRQHAEMVGSRSHPVEECLLRLADALAFGEQTVRVVRDASPNSDGCSEDITLPLNDGMIVVPRAVLATAVDVGRCGHRQDGSCGHCHGQAVKFLRELLADIR